ncbi:metalloprotease [Zeaxanthinibacter sp. PT1]|uniref:metalloprotease n=1 Tax=Zeaxanthinibacter TaxID=561554 RepID=UPI00234B8818|nr:metalloprotease [Zeaxanthinibacter sp. PT1]MDC6351431.1 metalloprotease [Zeaxanthinibacter sp. PT1]
MIQEIKGQHNNIITATLDAESKQIEIQQEFVYVNDSRDTLQFVYFNDWANAYSDKNTALAERFAEDFKKSLHLASEDERGYTEILGVVDDEYRAISYKHLQGKDMIRVALNKPLAPGSSVKIFFTYKVQLPPNKYTPYGYNSRGGYYLKDWYLTPVVYDSTWHLYSNKNLEDLYTDVTDTYLNFVFPDSLYLGTNFNEVSITRLPGKQYASLKGINRKNCDIILNHQKRFQKHVTPELIVVTDIQANKYDELSQGLSINRITRFIDDNLGKFPYEQLLVSEIDFDKNPLYGLNMLPSFIRPYNEQFQFEMKFLKTALRSYMRETVFLDPRHENWVSDAMVNYLMIQFVEEFYPDQKLLGKLSDIWGLRSFQLAQLDFNDQYSLFYMLMARKNLDQPLTTPNDSLIKFNQKIVNTYKAGLGLAYLGEYIGKERVDNSIKEFYQEYRLAPVTAADFERVLEQNSNKDIGWFFEDYVSSNKRIDFKIRDVEKTEDSLHVTLKNKTGTKVPISIFGLQNDSVVSKYWISGFEEEKEVTLPRGDEDRLVLNYDQVIPEFNQRDNWKSLNGFFSSNKKLKLQFLKDAEDPYYRQIFYMPVANFNIYDGVSPGIRITNKTLIERPFIFDFAPTYAMRERSMVGYGRFTLRNYHAKSGLYVSNFSLGGSTFHFQENSRYSTLTPSFSLGWRPDNLRSNKRQSLLLRHVNVFRTIDPSLGDLETEPDYSVLNARFIHSNNGIIDYFSWFADFQYENNFTKLALDMEYRKLFENNRQLNLRFFAGKFFSNTTNSDFFSFALDRPTDYLFDLNYLGRSEESGITSQQIIIAEGGFKSKIPNPFANDWMATTNASFNLWRWIEVYGDAGFLKNKGESARFVYDSGIRLNLVTDYFELYFPVYSSLGWELGQPNYDQKIRFIVTLSPRTLTGLFTRQWF